MWPACVCSKHRVRGRQGRGFAHGTFGGDGGAVGGGCAGGEEKEGESAVRVSVGVMNQTRITMLAVVVEGSGGAIIRM
jgi:hypothetical protein